MSVDDDNVTRVLDTFKDLLYGDEDSPLTADQFAPLLQLVQRLGQTASLVHFLPKVLPLSLKLLDHHDASLKIVGVSCIDCIVDSVPSHHLSQSGTDLLLLDTLLKSLNYNDTDFLRVVIPVILKSTRIFRLAPVKLDDLFLNVHQSIGMTCEIDKKDVLWSAMSPLIELLGVSSVKFVSHYIMPMISDQLSFPLAVVRDGNSASDENVISLFKGTLKTISALVNTVPSEILHPHMDSLVLSLAKFVFSNATFFSSRETEFKFKGEIDLRDLTRDTVNVLRSVDEEKFHRLTQIIFTELSKGPEVEMKADRLADFEPKLLCKKQAMEVIFCKSWS